LSPLRPGNPEISLESRERPKAAIVIGGGCVPENGILRVVNALELGARPILRCQYAGYQTADAFAQDRGLGQQAQDEKGLGLEIVEEARLHQYVTLPE
jgi:hypothetical protein